MQIDDQLISHLEHLSRLELSAEERDAIKRDLNNILAMVEKLQSLDLTGVAPLTQVSSNVNVLRDDVVQGRIDRDAALRDAPDQDGTYFRAPKIIER